MMTGPDLARLLAPLVGLASREHLAPLHRGKNLVALRYDYVTDWNKLGELLAGHLLDIQLHDGMEWFTLTLETIELPT